MRVGIEAINAYGGRACLDVRMLFQARGLDLGRFDNLMMESKAVAMPFEDPVTHAVNAAKPLLDALSAEERARIELVVTASESGLDFGKSLACYVHAHLGLSRNCRLFETKQACYAGTAALQMAVAWVAAQVSPGAKALVIATDVAGASARNTYAEPAQGSGAVAMLVSAKPDILAIDLGASGCYSFEVMDTCRPEINMETGDPDLSLMSYLDCLEHSFLDYTVKVEGADFQDTFAYLAFHTPFAGMVSGAHRMMMRKQRKGGPEQIKADFARRLAPSLHYGARVGNVYSGSLYLALCSLVDHADLGQPQRVGLFSYGSGCSSEFFSGVIGPEAQPALRRMGIGAALAGRHQLGMDEFEQVLDACDRWGFGVRQQTVERGPFERIYEEQFARRGLLVLTGVDNYHREYAWS